MLTFVEGVSREQLPSESDFDPYNGDLDARSAWSHFGGLSLEDAYVKFWEAPETYQEDFMFMGSNAFAYYFPVIDEYLRSVNPSGEGDDCPVKILGSCIAAQFEWKGAYLSRELRLRIHSLCDFVLSHLSRFASSGDETEEIKNTWLSVLKKARDGV